MPHKSIINRYGKKNVETAQRLIDAYDIVMRLEEGEWVGHALEYPEAIGVGKTVQQCMDETRKSLLIGVASMLQDGLTPPIPARQGVRSEQVNLRLTPEEKAVLESRSRTKGFRGIADYVRSSALEKA
ncbi:MAG: type II toxin-antitoxin system HicB family antitoxin [Planctomycetes bacterium]|jgi:predicted RNase H-like HicB family nuclease|nr:type II toxin-antitoxin system HicB family antitoxin [Planctomycetota bacterium]